MRRGTAFTTLILAPVISCSVMDRTYEFSLNWWIIRGPNRINNLMIFLVDITINVFFPHFYASKNRRVHKANLDS